MKSLHILYLAIIQIFCFIPTILHAQVKDSVNIQQQIKEVEVTSQRKISPTLSTNSVQTLSSKTIDDIGILSVSDAIRRFSGVVVKDFGGIGGMKTISVRGVGSEHTAVLYDGIAVGNAKSGQIDIGQFSLDNVEMLSLTIGQSDDIFQTARATAAVGVLNIETKKPLLLERKFQGSIQLRAGSWGQFNPYLYYAHKLNNKFSISLDGSWQRADGGYKFERKNVNKTISEKRKNSDVNIFRSELNLFGHLSDKQNISLKIYYFDSEQGLPGSFVLYTQNANERLWTKNFFTQAKYQNKFNSKFDLQVQGKYSHMYTKYIDKDGKYENGISKNIFEQNEVYLTSTLLYNYSKRISFSLAEDVSNANLSGDIENFAFPKRYSSLTALSAKYTDNRLSIVGKLLGTYITEDTKNNITADNFSRLSPSVSLSYKILKNQNLRIRASYKDIFRAPTFNDLYYSNMGNRNLKPEKTQQYNIGATWSHFFSDLLPFVSITTDVYQNSVSDKIIIYPSSFFPKTVNLGKVNINGVDISLNSHLDFTEKWGVDFSANYTYQKAIDKTDSEDKNYKDQIPYTPVHFGGGSIILQNPYVNISYSVLGSGKTYADAQNIDRNKIDGYFDHSVSLNKSFSLRNFKLYVQFDISNISNKTYYIMKDYPMPGRAYRITTRLNF